MTRLESVISKLKDQNIDIFKLMDVSCPEEYFNNFSCEYDGIKDIEEVTDMDCLKCWLMKSSKL